MDNLFGKGKGELKLTKIICFSQRTQRFFASRGFGTARNLKSKFPGFPFFSAFLDFGLLLFPFQPFFFGCLGGLGGFALLLFYQGIIDQNLHFADYFFLVL